MIHQLWVVLGVAGQLEQTFLEAKRVKPESNKESQPCQRMHWPLMRPSAPMAAPEAKKKPRGEKGKRVPPKVTNKERRAASLLSHSGSSQGALPRWPIAWVTAQPQPSLPASYKEVRARRPFMG